MLEPGDAVDVWVVDCALGRGGMGSVYRCHNRNAPRILAAVKVLEVPTSRHPDTTARFVREAEILFQLNHPNIVKVRNIRPEHDPPYLEMEFVEGESLEDVLQRGAVKGERAHDIIRQCATAVYYLHSCGVRHRDIKPANFLVRRDGRVKLVDFGLALEESISRITQHGMAFGTVSYAPPEWANPERLNPTQWDLYALGVVCWEILTGEVAFPVSGQGSARQQAMQVVLSKQSHAPLDPGEDHPEGLRALIRDLTQADPSVRLSDARTVLERLSEVGIGDGIPELTSEEDYPSVVTSAPTSGIPAPRSATPATWAEEPSSATVRTSQGIAIGAVLATLVGGGGIAALVALAVVGWWLATPSGRPVEVVVSGLPVDVNHDIALADRSADRRAGFSTHFSDVPPGPQRILWAVGEDCDAHACATEACPSWCVSGSDSREVRSGTGPLTLTLNLEAPARRSLRVSLPKLDDMTVNVALRPPGGATSWIEGVSVTGGVAVQDVLPGPYQMRVVAGTCPDVAVACWPEECPQGCVAFARDIEVPSTGAPPGPLIPADVLEAIVALAPGGQEATEPTPPSPAPTPPASSPTAPAPAAPAPEPPTPPAPRSLGPYVTVDQFAAFLETKEGGAFVPGGPRAVGTGHLSGWNGSTPPASAKGSNAITGVNWFAADQYCRTRGGLPSVDVRAPGGSGVFIEWRTGLNGQPAAFDGETQEAIPTNGRDGTCSIAGFRCTR